MSVLVTARFKVKPVDEASLTLSGMRHGTVTLRDLSAGEALTLRRILERNGCTTFESVEQAV